MVRQAPKLLAAGAITGFTDATHVIAHWLARIFTGSTIAGPIEELAASALMLSTIFVGMRLLRILGLTLVGAGNGCVKAHAAWEDGKTRLKHRAERLARRALLKLSAGVRHLGLRLAR